MQGRRSRSVLLGVIAAGLVLGAAATILVRSRLSRSPAASSGDARPVAGPSPKPPASEEPVVAGDRHVARRDATKRGVDSPAAADPLEAAEGAWDTVDLKAVRAAMPNNLFWTMGAPTDDPVVLEARDKERERWNTEYGKVLSNTATAEEIEAYYAFRRRLSLDYVEFATHLLSNYGTVLPLRDRSLLVLAVKMHMTRLEEIPRQIAEAQERREAHEAARKAWLEDQRTFTGDAGETP